MIADRIIAAVAHRHLVSEQRLIETELSDQLSVSRIPLREALRVLQSQGIVVAMPRRGVRLIAFDLMWSRELYDVRVALERLASQAAALRLRADAAARARLNFGLRELEIALGNEDMFAMAAADLAVHDILYDLSASPLLQTLWAAIARHVLVLFSMETYRSVDMRRVMADHRALRETLLRGSASDIDAEVARHVAGAHGFAAEKADKRRRTTATARTALSA